MLQIKDQTITLSIGDDAAVELKLFTSTNEPYTPEVGEIAMFTVKRKIGAAGSPSPLVKKVSSQWVFFIKSSDTQYLEAGEYAYDVRFFDKYGRVSTVCRGRLFLQSTNN